MTADDQVMGMLAEHVPVTLLLDIAIPPDTTEVYDTEGGVADWLADLRVGACA